MPQRMNTDQARVVDPILSTHARGYQNAEMIGHLVLPYVDIPTRGTQVIKFGKESFRRYNARRAPGARTERVRFGYAAEPVALHQESLEGFVPYEVNQEAQRVPAINLGQMAIELVQDSLQLGREYEIAMKVRDAATYPAGHVETLSGTSKWSDQSSDPSGDIDEAREQVRARIGRDPNQLTLGPGALKALRRHEKIKGQFKYTSSDSITIEMLAKYFDIERVIVGRAVTLPDDAEDDAATVDVWGDDAILTYTPTAQRSYMVPAFGYTYRLTGTPTVEQPYYERQTKSWVYPYVEEWEAVVAGAEGGFLFKGVS